MIITVLTFYLLLVLTIGILSHRLFRNTGEDYFVASRTIGPFVLLMTLFGTNMTAFAILGASGEAYRSGIGVFALMASSSALVIPAIFYFVGTRLWRLGKRHGYLTQIQFFRERWGSDTFGLVLFMVLAGLLVPYLLIGVMGAGITLRDITDGSIPKWVGSTVVCLVIFFYVTYSGMRGTAWVNTFQTLVFMALGATAFFVIFQRYGGLGQVMERLGETHPELLIRGDLITPAKLLSYTLIPVSAGMFPHIFTHWLTASKVKNFKTAIIFYPLCMVVVWVPSVLLGVTGHLDFGGLEGPAANSVLVKMVEFHAQGLLGGLLGAGIFAAIMSSLDSQTLSLGNMFTQDIVRHYKLGGEMDELKQVWWGRVFVCFILGVTLFIALVASPAIFSLGVWSFTGFASLFPLVVGAVFWRRSTKIGAWSCLITVIGLWIYFFSQGPPTAFGSSVLAVAVIFIASSLAMVIGSLLSSPPPADRLRKFFEEPST